MKTEKIPCSKCNGKGKIQGFAMVAGGTCFQCKGSGYRMGTKEDLQHYNEIKKAQKQDWINYKNKEKTELKLFNNLKPFKSTIEMVINIKQTEDIENDPESKFVYDRQKGKIKEYLTEYKKYKITYKTEMEAVEKVLKQYNITCV